MVRLLNRNLAGQESGRICEKRKNPWVFRSNHRHHKPIKNIFQKKSRIKGGYHYEYLARHRFLTCQLQDFYGVIERRAARSTRTDKETGMLLMDHSYTSTHYPTTTALSGDTGLTTTIRCAGSVFLKPNWCLHPQLLDRRHQMMEDGKKDEKSLCLPYCTLIFNSYEDISELPEHIMKEMSHFFSV